MNRYPGSTMNDLESENTVESTPSPLATILVCPHCATPWSADYADYSWMQDTDLVICACGEALCEVSELRDS